MDTISVNNSTLVDLGISAELANRSLLGTLSATPGSIAGTVRYMSPEVLQGRSTSAATDVHGLGLVLFETLYGLPPLKELPIERAVRDPALPRPFAGEFVLRRLSQEVDTPPIEGVPPWLLGLIGRMLRRNPTERPALEAEIIPVLVNGGAAVLHGELI